MESTDTRTVESRQELLVGPLPRRSVHLIGLGMHGSWVAQLLARLNIGQLTVWDHDTVGEENLETQAYRLEDVGKTKVDATYENLKLTNWTGRYVPKVEPFSVHCERSDILISCADDMTTRKQVATAAREHRALMFMESRSAEHVAFIYAFKPTKANLDTYIKTAFPSDIKVAACGATGTAAVGMAVASTIGGLLMVTEGGRYIDGMPAVHEVTAGMSHIMTNLGE